MQNSAIRLFPQTLSSSHTRSILSANNFHSFCNLHARRSEDILLSAFRRGIRRGGGDITALRRSRICAYFFDPKTLGFISATVLRLSCRRYQDVKLNRFKKRLAGFFCSLALANFGCGVFDHLHPERRHVSRGPLLEMQASEMEHQSS